MIKLFFNPYVQGYEVYVNGVKVDGVANVRIDAANDFNGPKATIIAMVEIVNEKPSIEGIKISGQNLKEILNRNIIG